MSKEVIIDQIVECYLSKKHEFQLFLNGVRDYFLLDPELNSERKQIIHSIKFRLKNPEHLRDKLLRKWDDTNLITEQNMFNRITDLAGVRILHLHQDQFPFIHKKILDKVNSTDWIFAEEPKAYTWDPESVHFYGDLGINCMHKDSFYTSIHYIVKPKKDSHINCEVQVRTLFEEIWGEVDHTINYPYSTESIACKEQLKVFSKLVSTGTRLADSIFRSYHEYLENKKTS